jgi:hypothetical protein
MDYAPLSASGGSASSTVSGKDSAVAAFRSFLCSMNVDYDTADESILCQITLLQKFATYLMTYTSKATKSQISLGTMLQYLSGAKETLLRRFPNASIFNDGDYKFSTNNSWYKKIINELYKQMIRQCIEKGEAISDTTIPLGREGCIKCITAMVKQQTSDAVEKAFAINITRNGVGRGGEAGFANYRLVYWDFEEQCLSMDWNILKTTDSKIISMHPDCKSLQMDFFFMGALFNMVGGAKRFYCQTSGSDTDKWVLPNMAFASCATTYLSKAIQTVKERIGISDNITAKSIRAGCINDLIADYRNITPSMVVARTGQDMTNVSRNIFQIITVTFI